MNSGLLCLCYVLSSLEIHIFCSVASSKVSRSTTKLLVSMIGRSRYDMTLLLQDAAAGAGDNYFVESARARVG